MRIKNPPAEIQSAIDQILSQLKEAPSADCGASYERLTSWCEEHEDEVELFGIEHGDEVFLAIDPRYDGDFPSDENLLDSGVAEDPEDITDERRLEHLRENSGKSSTGSVIPMQIFIPRAQQPNSLRRMDRRL